MSETELTAAGGLRVRIRLAPAGSPLRTWRQPNSCRDYEAAIEAAQRVIHSYPDHPLVYRWLAAALGQVGRIDEAREALAKAIAIAPASFDLYVPRRVPWLRPEDYAHTLEGLRKARWQG